MHSCICEEVLTCSLCASADDDKLFELQGSDSFPDALSDLGSLSEQPDDNQVRYEAPFVLQCQQCNHTADVSIVRCCTVFGKGVAIMSR